MPNLLKFMNDNEINFTYKFEHPAHNFVQGCVEGVLLIFFLFVHVVSISFHVFEHLSLDLYAS
jgi:hypothetical protein